MSWPRAKEIQSWKDICEKLLGIKFNNGKEITSYPITERGNLADPSNRYTLASYDTEPCNSLPPQRAEIKDYSYGELFAGMYHILMTEYVNRPFNKTNLEDLLEHGWEDAGRWGNYHDDDHPATAKLGYVIGGILADRVKMPFSQDTEAPQEDLAPIALGLTDTWDNDLAKVLVKSYNNDSTFVSVLNSMKKDVFDTVRTMPAPLTAPYINLGVKGWLDASLERKWRTDEEWLQHHGGNGSCRAESHAKIQKKAKTLFETKLEDYVKLNFEAVKPASNVSAYLNSTHRWDLRFTYVDKQPVPLIPIVVSIDWDKLSEECGREDTNS